MRRAFLPQDTTKKDKRKDKNKDKEYKRDKKYKAPSSASGKDEKPKDFVKSEKAEKPEKPDKLTMPLNTNGKTANPGHPSVSTNLKSHQSIHLID